MDLRRYPLTAETDTGLLVRLAEECSEVIKAVTKIQRFGLHGDHTPDRQDFKRDNMRDLCDEVRDVNLVWGEIFKRGIMHKDELT